MLSILPARAAVGSGRKWTIAGQKTVRLASSYEYVVMALREKMLEYIGSSYLLVYERNSVD